MGEAERARTIYKYVAQYADPNTFAMFWDKFNEFEIRFGNVDTHREMKRVKRGAEAAYAQIHFNATDITEQLDDARDEMEMYRLQRALPDGDAHEALVKEQAACDGMASGCFELEEAVQYLHAHRTAELERDRAARRAERAVVHRSLLDVVEARQRPEIETLIVVHGRFVAQAPVDRVRIDVDLVGIRVVLERRRGGVSHQEVPNAGSTRSASVSRLRQASSGGIPPQSGC